MLRTYQVHLWSAFGTIPFVRVYDMVDTNFYKNENTSHRLYIHWVPHLSDFALNKDKHSW